MYTYKYIYIYIYIYACTTYSYTHTYIQVCCVAAVSTAHEDDTLEVYICPHTTVYVSSYFYTRVLILLYMCPRTSIRVSSYAYYYMCVRILLYICPHAGPRCDSSCQIAPALTARSHSRYSVYLLYWYKSTNTDT